MEALVTEHWLKHDVPNVCFWIVVRKPSRRWGAVRHQVHPPFTDLGIYERSHLYPHVHHSKDKHGTTLGHSWSPRFRAIIPVQVGIGCCARLGRGSGKDNIRFEVLGLESQLCHVDLGP